MNKNPAPSHAGLAYVLGRIIQDFMRSMHRSGLSAPQIHALLFIYHSPNGECGLSEIGGLTGASDAAVSQLIERLVQQELVERTEDSVDRRNKKLRLTTRSLRLIETGIGSNHFLTDLMASLPARQRETVHAAFGYLAHAGQQIQITHERKERKHA
jgi:DNA-binding MarR family transcriptional regulator